MLKLYTIIYAILAYQDSQKPSDWLSGWTPRHNGLINLGAVVFRNAAQYCIWALVIQSMLEPDRYQSSIVFWLWVEQTAIRQGIFKCPEEQRWTLAIAVLLMVVAGEASDWLLDMFDALL